MSSSYKLALSCAAMIAVLTCSREVAAQAGPAWPSKPIRWIVPFPPGGPADVIARIVSQKLAERVGQSGVVENRAGAGGNVGHDAAAKAAPDGHTLLFVVPGIVTNPFFYKVSVDPFKDLVPVIHLDSASMVLLANAAFPPKTIAETLAYVRANTGAVSCGVSGALPQVGCEMLRSYAKTGMILVPYKGQAPAMAALMGGEINLMFEVVNNAIGQVNSGRVRAIASTNPRRGIGPFADLPVIAETIPDFELLTWHGVMVPRETPREIVLRINRELGAVLEQPDIRQRLAEGGLEVTGGPPEAFEALLRRDYAKYGKALQEAGIKPE